MPARISARARRRSDPYEITTDGKTVWINDATGLIGRFSRLGIDVHVDGQCRGDSCVKGPFNSETGPAAWDAFKEKMLALHGVQVKDKFFPKGLSKGG